AAKRSVKTSFAQKGRRPKRAAFATPFRSFIFVADSDPRSHLPAIAEVEREEVVARLRGAGIVAWGHQDLPLAGFPVASADEDLRTGFLPVTGANEILLADDHAAAALPANHIAA